MVKRAQEKRAPLKTRPKRHRKKMICCLIYFRWEDAKRAYLKFIDNGIITRHITRNPFTLGYTYYYIQKHIEYIQNYRLLHKKTMDTK